MGQENLYGRLKIDRTHFFERQGVNSPQWGSIELKTECFKQVT